MRTGQHDRNPVTAKHENIALTKDSTRVMNPLGTMTAAFHVMPPRITRNSYRPRASDRTMVDLESPFASRSRKLDGAANSSEETYGNGRHESNFFKGSLIIVGWISRKHLNSGRRRSFSLTSLFIELIDPLAPILSAIAIFHHAFLILR